MRQEVKGKGGAFEKLEAATGSLWKEREFFDALMQAKPVAEVVNRIVFITTLYQGADRYLSAYLARRADALFLGTRLGFRQFCPSYWVTSAARLGWPPTCPSRVWRLKRCRPCARLLSRSECIATYGGTPRNTASLWRPTATNTGEPSDTRHRSSRRSSESVMLSIDLCTAGVPSLYRNYTISSVTTLFTDLGCW